MEKRTFNKGIFWIGLIGNLILGLLFPYVFVGCVILLHGFMAPPTPKQQWTGAGLALVYLSFLVLCNAAAIRETAGAEKWKRLAGYAVVFVIGAAVSFGMLRLHG